MFGNNIQCILYNIHPWRTLHWTVVCLGIVDKANSAWLMLTYGAQLEIYGLIFWHLLLAASLETQSSKAKCILAWYLYLLYLYTCTAKHFLSQKVNLYRTQVNLASHLWVWRCFEDFIEVALVIPVVYHLPLAHFPPMFLTHLPPVNEPFTPYVWHFYPPRFDTLPPFPLYRNPKNEKWKWLKQKVEQSKWYT